MLILPPGHAQTVRLRRLSTREKWMVRSVAAAVALILIVVVIALASGGKSSSHGCIYVTLPAPTGAQVINQCGGTARSTCASLGKPGAFTRQGAREVADACRKAGLPVRR